MTRAQFRQVHYRTPFGTVLGIPYLGAVRMALHSGREAMQLVEDVKVDVAGFAPDETAEHDVARAQAWIKRCKRSLRLDDEAGPAALVEPHRDVVGDGVPAADVDVEACRLTGESQRQVIVLEVLRVREVHVKFFAGASGADRARLFALQVPTWHPRSVVCASGADLAPALGCLRFRCRLGTRARLFALQVPTWHPRCQLALIVPLRKQDSLRAQC